VEALNGDRAIETIVDIAQRPVTITKALIQFRGHLQHAIGQDHLRARIYVPVLRACHLNLFKILQVSSAQFIHEIVVTDGAELACCSIEIRIDGTLLRVSRRANGFLPLLGTDIMLDLRVKPLVAGRSALC